VATLRSSSVSLPVAETEQARLPDGQVRAFVAVELPEEHRVALADFVDRWRGSEENVRWVPAENLHLTLRFLGNVPRSEIEPLTRMLEEELAPLEAFELVYGKPGSFPSRGAPRILWIGLEGNLEALRGLHQAVERCVTQLGFASEEERFSPHVTVGRLRPNRRISLTTAPALKEMPAFTVQAASLMVSKLMPQGAQYSRLALLPLQHYQDVR
jgi:2'-5' RNA ligase